MLSLPLYLISSCPCLPSTSLPLLSPRCTAIASVRPTCPSISAFSFDGRARPRADVPPQMPAVEDRSVRVRSVPFAGRGRTLLPTRSGVWSGVERAVASAASPENLWKSVNWPHFCPSRRPDRNERIPNPNMGPHAASLANVIRKAENIDRNQSRMGPTSGPRGRSALVGAHM